MTKEIQESVCKNEVLKFNTPCENVSFFSHESDVLSINKSGYLTEFEIKISRSDFKADFKKRKWLKHNFNNENRIANRFYYVCPKGMILENEVPDFAGLIYYLDDVLIYVKTAPLLHKTKHDKDKVLKMFCRILSERKYLGSCRMTYNNKLIMERSKSFYNN